MSLLPPDSVVRFYLPPASVVRFYLPPDSVVRFYLPPDSVLRFYLLPDSVVRRVVPPACVVGLALSAWARSLYFASDQVTLATSMDLALGLGLVFVRRV